MGERDRASSRRFWTSVVAGWERDCPSLPLTSRRAAMSVASSFPCSLSANSTSSEGLAPLPLSTSVGSVRSPSRSPSESNTTGSSVGALERSDWTERSSSDDAGTVVKARSSPLLRKACASLALLAMISSGHLSGAKAAFRSDVPVCSTRANMAVNRSALSPRLLLSTSAQHLVARGEIRNSSCRPRAGDHMFVGPGVSRDS